jgi:Xaa-Pro aminopeptidase
VDDDVDTRTPREELDWRHRALVPHLENAGLDLTIVVTNPNLYYLTGSIQEGMMVISPECPGPVYMVRRVLERARYESPLEDIRPSVSPSRLAEALGIKDIDRVGLELDTIPHAWVERLKSSLGEGVELFNVSATIRAVRSAKSRWEVARIKEASDQVDHALERARLVLTEGMTEVELSAELEREMRRLGHEGMVRMHRFGSEMHIGGVLSGISATMPTWHQAVMGGSGLSPSLPHGASRRKIQRGEPVAIDLCGISRGYIADETRTIVIGHLSDEAAEVQAAAQEILKAMEAELVPGAHNEAVWMAAEAMAEEEGVTEGFMGVGDTRMRFIGHGVGLELDELPVLADGMPGQIPEGAVIAIEPKVVIPGLGVLGEENTYHVTSHGAKQLTLAPPGPIEV